MSGSDSGSMLSLLLEVGVELGSSSVIVFRWAGTQSGRVTVVTGKLV